MEHYESESDSCSSQELESELYSVLHYNCFSDELPSHILEKYNIRRENNEFFISLKNNSQAGGASSSPPASQHQGMVEDETSVLKDIASSESSSSGHAAYPDSGECVTETPSNIECHKSAKKAYSSLKKHSLHTENLPATKNFQGNNIDVISVDDSSEDSDVIIEEVLQDVTYISSSSSIECLSDSDDMDGILLNTTIPNKNIFPDDDTKEEKITVKWRDVASPSTWSDGMKKYYNKPSKQLKYFDHKKILQEIKGQGPGNWHILPQDLFPAKGPIKRCSLCRQTDHLIKNCPKRFSNCSMCGNPGHSAANCPFRMCLNCGKQSSVFISMCQQCESSRGKVCAECKQVGHIRANCPDTWRRYHSTIGGELVSKPETVNEKLLCCNCGKEGHLFEKCTNLYWSSYPPNSFHVKNKKDLHHSQGKRKLFNSKESFQEKRKPRWSEPNFNKKRYFDNNPSTPQRNKNNHNNFNTPQSFKMNYNKNSNTPQSNKKKKKKKTKSPHFQNNMQFNNTF